MKTILHLSSSSGPGGAERIVCALAASLDKTRYRSLVGLFRPGWLKDECEQRGLPVYVLPSEGFMNWRWMLACYRLVKQERVDLIQAHEFDANVHGTLVAKWAGIPLVATVHGKNRFFDARRRRWAYRFISKSVQMVAVSEDLKNFIVEQTQIPGERIKVIYNGVDEPATFDVADREIFKQGLGIPADHLVVGVVGNLYPVKGHTYLLAAIPEILKRCPNVTFLFAGRGELEVPLKAQARELGIEANVHFLGLRQDVPRLLTIMDLFAMPSLSEGLSIALLEAMAAGKPVVATRVGGNPELVVNGETGLLVPAKDASGLADALVQMLQDAAFRERAAAAAQRHVAQRFTCGAMAGQYTECYDRMVKV
ncbi:glycosyl transferase family 1 [Nitrospira sp.]|nr:glycosyl transferase family 1 [Nitrospira sp.]